ncbi:MAG: YcfA family protein [Parcubacteria group bacterium GW2011_GWA1_44_13]|uniref:YcfA family protein n=1 Tax=Candidatus Nomurabacteria bacterium GW2011_GWB1_44_12 TaxID=1618748 RepID=A0A837I834_9BACT|nr:MAG: YcfA family protein [Candidatus Nomurabacteria bacterium GW2011_GWD1_44_10]KKT36998.1 MAG: YcfA family protein [Candidatus Nomurabacteria bacterium GW2011_GWB1_44_12]KKT37816.1 MAG: YcfA family protein [Parcubacteria group bacterium GW2011_GWA1_44_13]KKT59467.1 MAG: YcfA family protein [Parcubacteria group bacterium GW2011_GWC1_44_26]
MPKLSPISQRDLIQRLRKLNFEGPYQEGKHPYMIRGNLVITIPNPHKKDISVDLLTRILRQAGVTSKEWNDK